MNLSDADFENLLRQHFGQDEFDPDQKEIISSVLSGRDVLAVTHRGFDKSICYRLPALALDGLTLVLSRAHQIVDKEVSDLLPATHINSSLSSENLQKRIWAMAQGEYKLVYVGPEQFRNRAFLFAIAQNPLSLLVVEDAHCISRYGYDFRPEYLDINKALLEIDPIPRILALASPCTQQTRDDICTQLQIDRAEFFISDLTLPNLSIEIKSAISTEEKYDVLESVMLKLQGSGIVFANSRRQVSEICDFLNDLELNATVYHGGLGRDKRGQIENDFVAGQLRVLVATSTSSFGMSMGKANVGYVIHFNMPDRLERYYEHISFAGRDGKPGRCVLIYSPSDRDFHRSLIERNSMPPSEFWRLNDVLNRRMKKFAKKENSRQDKHYRGLSLEAQKELDKLKREFNGLSHPKDRDEYDYESEYWQRFSKRMRREYESCEICGDKSEHVHHRHYGTPGRERPRDVVVLCASCHHFIHPDSQMVMKEFEEERKAAKMQPSLFDILEPKIETGLPIEPILVVSREQIEIEAAISRHKLLPALSDMESAGMLRILPDCSMQARVRILASRSKLTAYAMGDAGEAVVRWLLDNSKSDPRGEIDVDFAGLEEDLHLRHDVLEDFFLELHYVEAISYKPSHRAMAISLEELDASRMDDIFEKLKGERYQALRDMEEYAHTRECRRIFLCDYLGAEVWNNCGKCDNCINANYREVDSGDAGIPQYARAAMELVRKGDGRLNKAEIVRILTGMDQRTTRYDKWPQFGALSIFTSENVQQLLDMLVGHGFLKEEGGFHPPMDLTEKGFRALKGESDDYEKESILSLVENMKQIARTSVVPEKAESDKDRALIAILRCAKKTDGQVGRLGLAEILLGKRSKRLAKYEFDHIEEFGLLADMPKKAVLEHIDEMLERGCLSISSFFFPMVQLTDLGRRRLEKMQA